MVTNYLFVKIILRSVPCIHYKLIELISPYFYTFVELMVVANLGKNLQPSVTKWGTGQ